MNSFTPPAFFDFRAQSQPCDVCANAELFISFGWCQVLAKVIRLGSNISGSTVPIERHAILLTHLGDPN